MDQIHTDGITQPIEVVNSTNLFFLWNGEGIQIDIWLPTDSILELYDSIHVGKQQPILTLAIDQMTINNRLRAF